MPEEKIKEVADQANMIIAGFAYTLTDNNTVRVLDLEDPEGACVLQLNGELLETSMDDMKQAMAQGYYLKNREFMEV